MIITTLSKTSSIILKIEELAGQAIGLNRILENEYNVICLSNIGKHKKGDLLGKVENPKQIKIKNMHTYKILNEKVK